ncbi:MAG: roadblock/LC7 domain-containing protein [Actinomycetia bacterium]|nr:roadblock/LC7 domain-containing protein [Actinomycetes bacterium]
MTGRRGLVINDEQMQMIDGVLTKLQRVTASKFVALVSTSGQPITTSPPHADADILSLAALAAGSFAATRQLAAVLKEREFSLLFHEGKESNLHVMQVTERILLLITFGHETQVGRVRLYTGRAVEVLKPIFEAAENTTGEERIIDRDYSREAGSAIDSWFPGEGDRQG